MTTPNVKRIVEIYLKHAGFDGLLEEHCECACEVSDLMPCESEHINQCRAGWKTECDPETCNLEGDCDWHITIDKPEARDKR